MFSFFSSDLRLLHNLDPFQPSFEWSSPGVRSRSSLTDRDREELAPDYKDPDSSATEEKPILQPKPQQNETDENKNEKPQQGLDSIIPGGVVDVDTSGFGAPFSNEFDFGLDKPFRFGDLIASLNRNQWWKG